MPFRLCILILALLTFTTARPSSAQEADGLRFSTPSGFVELADRTSDLFRDSETMAVRGGRLLKIYLPQYMAHQYRYGKRHEVTRQVLICALEEGHPPLGQKEGELLARSMESLFNGFMVIPRGKNESRTDQKEMRTEAIRQSRKKGKPLLVDSLRTPSAYLHTCLIYFPMAQNGPESRLAMALGVAVVPVKETVLFVTAGSLVGPDDALPHLAWAKDSASAFADMIAGNNKPEKK